MADGSTTEAAAAAFTRTVRVAAGIGPSRRRGIMKRVTPPEGT
jgi:hypothetical protein